MSGCLPALSPSLHCVNMHEDLRGINSVGVRIATAFSISTEKGFNGLIMNRITSPTANYKFLKGEGKESLLWGKVYAADKSHGRVFWFKRKSTGPLGIIGGRVAQFVSIYI